MDIMPHWVAEIISILAMLFIFCVGLGVLAVIILFFIDRSQCKDAVRRNFPVLGRFRSLFSTLGEFFRQYFFAMDREEMPFNRAERDWVYRAAKGDDNTVAFGSTKNLNHAGSVIFVNCFFPILKKNAAKTKPMIIGEYCKQPYAAPSFFNISAMSYGALSKPAVQALSRGAKIAGCWLNTGEGGLSPYHLEGGADLVFQIGTAKYGVRDSNGNMSDEKLKDIAAHEQVKMIELKFSQGAKPGKGGILPASKVTEEIAAIRGIKAGEASISPNRHSEIDDIPSLLDFIAHIRDVSGKPTGFKLVIGDYDSLDEMCREIHKRGIKSAPDFITVDSGDGGTGAAPMPLMDNVGLLIKESLPTVSDMLYKYGLRERIKIIASGKLITPAEVAWALCAGADFVNSARGFLFSLGCVQALKCNKNTCPTGITTHDKRLQSGLCPSNKSAKVANYAKNVIHEVEIIANSCGVSESRELRRKHIRIVRPDGKSVSMDKLYPRPEVIAEFDGAA